MIKLTIEMNTLLLSLILLVVLYPLTAIAYTKVIYAINAGGDEHIDSNQIHYEKDPLKIGTSSDFGKQLLSISRVKATDEIIYQTERYSTSTFGYDLPVAGDGEYVLILKFCEVYFNAVNQKVFDVVLNSEHTVISDLDIFQQVGRGAAHDEYIHFSVSRGNLYYKEEESEIRGGKIKIEFIKGYRDNPKINAIVLIKGDLDAIQILPPPHNTILDVDHPHNTQHYDSSDSSDSHFDNLALNSDDEENEKIVPESRKNRKTSGPKQPNPYSLDESSMMLPVFIAIGAFIPLLFCLCKL